MNPLSTSIRQEGQRWPISARGFTLVEVLIGLALFSILVGGIFTVQKGALEVSKEVVDSETRTLRMHSFCELLRRNFEQMPGNAQVNLQFYGGSGSDMTEVAFTDYPLAFTWPGVTAGAKTVIFRTERSTGIGLQAAILYLDEEQADAWRKGGFDETKILGRITIMDGIASLSWRFFDDTKATGTNKDDGWEEEWPLTNTRRPTQVEMTLQFMDGSDPVRLVFWIPTMLSPQQFTAGFAPQTPQIPGGGPPGGGPPGGPGAGPPGGPGGGGRPPGGGGGGRPGGGGGRPGGGGR